MRFGKPGVLQSLICDTSKTAMPLCLSTAGFFQVCQLAIFGFAIPNMSSINRYPRVAEKVAHLNILKMANIFKCLKVHNEH